MESQNSNPLIFTLAMDDASAGYFNTLREKYFPPAINYLKAHLTLFHKLPPDQPEAMQESLAVISSMPSFSLQTTGFINLGRGVAFKIASEPLEHLHGSLAKIWRPWLSPQDDQKFRPHITIQNKVHPQEARALLESVSSTFAPIEAQCLGINCFEYLGGPWKLLTHISFSNV